MFDHRNTPFQRHFRDAGLADNESRDIAPASWPTIGESRFRLLSRKGPAAAAITHGDFHGPTGEVIKLHADYDLALPKGADIAVFRAPTKPRKLPDINWYGAYFIVTEAALSVFRSLDPSAVAYQRIPFEFERGEPPSTPVYLMNVVRIADLVDLDRTYFVLKSSGGGLSARDYGPLGIRRDIPEAVHVCRDSSFPEIVALSSEIIAALTRAQIKGWQAKDPADHYRLAAYLRKD